MLKNMHKANFTEEIGLSGIWIPSNIEGISVEDQKFSKIIDETAQKVEAHYHIPLTLKNECPNNRYAAEKRLDCLKRRYLCDPKFLMTIRDSYKIFWKKPMEINPHNMRLLEELGTFHIMGLPPPPPHPPPHSPNNLER